jgi:hypothetical protein
MTAFFTHWREEETMRIFMAGVVALGLCLVSGASAPLHSAGLSGKYDVRRVELALDLQRGASRARVTLASGQGIDVALSGPEATDRLVEMMGAVAQGARMAVHVEDGEVRSLYLIVGARE